MLYLTVHAIFVSLFSSLHADSAASHFPLQLTDFLVGDGPGSRYALICTQCYSHNGMALKDEFEYTGNVRRSFVWDF